MGGTVQTQQTSSNPTNPDVQPTVSQLLKGLQGATSSGTKVFGQTLYPGLSSTTQGGLNSLVSGANPAGYQSSIGGAISDFGDVAAGNRFGTNDPGYQALRAKAGEDTLRDVNALFTGSGRFGSGSHVKNATESLGNVYAGMDYQNFQNDQARQMAAAGMLPQLQQAYQLPAQTQLQAGQIMDADALARRQAENDLFRRQSDAPWDTLAKGSSILAGTAPYGGQTQSTEVPWWAAGLGIGTGLAGAIF